MLPLQEGDTGYVVRIDGPRYTTAAIKVESLTKTLVVLEDGSKWLRKNGCPKGTGKSQRYYGPWLMSHLPV